MFATMREEIYRVKNIYLMNVSPMKWDKNMRASVRLSVPLQHSNINRYEVNQIHKYKYICFQILLQPSNGIYIYIYIYRRN